jgi:hypothetical protein
MGGGGGVFFRQFSFSRIFADVQVSVKLCVAKYAETKI